jgi:S-formylglutathione hydrolase
MTADLKLLEEHACFGGRVIRYEHASESCRGPMRFSIYLPPQAAAGRVPIIYFLAGLTCTEETFMIKAGAQRYAAKHGLALVAPDTSPRRTGIPDETRDWDLGSGASFYVDATRGPWDRHYRMHRYVADELPALIAATFPVDDARQALCGHSMGGHGALTIGLRHADRYRSLSAFAPVCAPSRTPWGQKAFGTYLGTDEARWQDYDAVALLQAREDQAIVPMLVDQGLDDPYLERELKTQWLEGLGGGALTLRWHKGYDHSYFFIASFIGDHLAFHARHLGTGA